MGIRPLRTTIAWALSSGSSTTSHRPTPRKMIAAKTISPTAKATRIAHTKLRFRVHGAYALLSISKRAHGIAAHQCGQLPTATVNLLTGIYSEDACAR